MVGPSRQDSRHRDSQSHQRCPCRKCGPEAETLDVKHKGHPAGGRTEVSDFPGGPVVENPPANAGDMV